MRFSWVSLISRYYLHLLILLTLFSHLTHSADHLFQLTPFSTSSLGVSEPLLKSPIEVNKYYDKSPCTSSIEQRRADARLIIVHGLFEIPLPSYIHRQTPMTRTTHPYHFIQIQTTASYYKYSFFPLAIVQWNNLPTSAVLSEDLTTFRSAICSLNHIMP